MRVGPVAARALACLAGVDMLVVSTLPPFYEAVSTSKNNELGARFACFLTKKGGQKAPISPSRKIREPCGPDDRMVRNSYQRDPSGLQTSKVSHKNEKAPHLRGFRSNGVVTQAGQVQRRDLPRLVL